MFIDKTQLKKSIEDGFMLHEVLWASSSLDFKKFAMELLSECQTTEEFAARQLDVEAAYLLEHASFS